MCRPTKRPRPVAVAPSSVVATEEAAVDADFPELETLVFDLKPEALQLGEFWAPEYNADYSVVPDVSQSEDSRPRTFVFTTYDMVSDSKNAMAIGFNEEGNVIEIRDLDILSEKILPLYFRHKNVTSFYRQLNSYGFRTTRSSMTNVVHAFSHDLFRASRPELLTGIMRKKCMKKLARLAAQKDEEEKLRSSLQVSPPSPMSVSSGSSDETKVPAVAKTMVPAPLKRVATSVRQAAAPLDVEGLRMAELRTMERMHSLESRNRRLDEENRAAAVESERVVLSVNEMVDAQTSLIAMLFGAEAAKAFSEQSMPFRMLSAGKAVEEQARDFDRFDNATEEMFGSDDDLKVLEDIFACEAGELLA